MIRIAITQHQLHPKRGSKMTIAKTEAQERQDSRLDDSTSEPDTTEPDTTESNADHSDETPGDSAVGKVKPDRGSKSISLSLRSLVLGGLIVALVAATAIMGWLYFGARQQLSAQASQAANDERAEKIALDYAVNAATMDFNDLQGWKVKLVAGTSPELSKKLSEAGTSMEQLLVPLQWSSTAQPLLAKVRSSAGGIYVVDSFVSVQTKTVQAPEALQSTATYSTTIDSNNNWQITDVGGIGSALGGK